MANQMNVLPQVHASTPSSGVASSAKSVTAKDKGAHDEFSAKLAQAKDKNKSGMEAKAPVAEEAAPAKVLAAGTMEPVKEISKDGKKTTSKEQLAAAQAQVQAQAQAQFQASALAATVKAQPIVVTEKPVVTEAKEATDATGKAVATPGIKSKLTPELNANLQAQLQVQSQLKGKASAKVEVAEKTAPPTPLDTAAVALAAAQLGGHGKRAEDLQQAPNQAMQAKDFTGLAALQEQYQFEVDGRAAGEKPVAVSGKDAKTPTKLNTSDFLNLREMSQSQAKPVVMKDAISNQPNFPRFDQTLSQFHSQTELKNAMGVDAKKSKAAALTTGAMAGTHSGQVGTQNFAKVIDAPVTTGSQQKPVLSHDAVNQITSQINLMSLAKQDGEIKIRLRPDHLGEMHMSVKTQGQTVSIQITAHSSESKKIIEESLSSLKDSLGAQNLILANIEVVTPTNSASNGHDMNMQSDNSSARQHNDSGFGSNSERNSRQERLFEAEQNSVNLNTVRNVNFGRPAAGSTQNLDLIAS